MQKDQIEKMFASVGFVLKELPDAKPSVGFADFEYLRDRRISRLRMSCTALITNMRC